MPALRELTSGEVSFVKLFWQSLAEDMAEYLYQTFLPIASFSEGQMPADHLLNRQINSIIPFYGYTIERTQVLLAEGKEGEETYLMEMPEEKEDTALLSEMLRTENEAAMNAMKDLESGQGVQENFVPNQLEQRIDIEDFSDYEALVKRFYTIDANTMAGSDQLNAKLLAEKDMSIDRNVEGPQILIYHTHSQERFSDSVPGDESTTIMGVGEHLTEILTEKYGYQVLHHMGKYDVTSRDDAYSAALPDIEKVLKENPTIQVVIDLHRDQVPESTHLVMDVGGRPTARFMFFNGMSRTKKTGNISYLYNENLESNLAFSFQMQIKAESYYPGLARKIYLKGYRYNMHLCPKSLLIELGGQNNTLEEALNACDPIAHLLDMVLTP
ncbi:MAG: stage II sporulation protein P [Lachnoclostridium sp.]|nr:stage II sporulation protein P [Lachnospira sp.]MCM1247089.1 stage II sporulation protein P [Lachnoclostridium sp.]MCM1536062.1 stage II sporulation protein P [Clostridium sp.]